MAPQLELHSKLPRSEFVVIHPLHDEPEQKCDAALLGPMKMSPSVRFSLIILRAYLLVMGLMLSFHMLDLAGLFGRHGVN